MHAITIGLDIAKSVFQVHGVGGKGEVVHRRRLKRRDVEAFFAKQPRALIGIEACGTSHHWARLLSRQGHEVRLMPPAYVKPYVKRNKTDARDAEAICEAVCRPTMRFVPVKSEAQQAARALHRVRDLLVRQRTQLANVIRGLSAEFGMVEPVGTAGFATLVARLAQETRADAPEPATGADPEAAKSSAPCPVPAPLREILIGLAQQWRELSAKIDDLAGRILAEGKHDPQARRLMAVPGVGPMLSHAAGCAVPDPSLFKSARDFAAWIGLTPLQNSSGGRTRLGEISRAGDASLRRLFVLGAAAVVRQARIRPDRADPWLIALLARRPTKVAIVALAAKTARIVFALMASGESYRVPAHRASSAAELRKQDLPIAA